MSTHNRRLFVPFVAEALRPPGAKPEDEFQALCILCQRCTASCPYHSIKLAGLKHGLSLGTPIIEPRDVPCYLCMICPDVCPTGALEPLAKEKVNMGMAVVTPERCYAFQGILCRTCVDICPFQDTAIRQDLELRPVIDPDACVGCGMCVKVCPAQPEAIRVQREN